MVDFSFGFFEMALSSASLISCYISLTLFFDTVWSKNSITCIVAVSLCEWWILKWPAGPFVIPFGSDRSKRIPPWAHMLRTLRTVSMYCSKTAVCFTPKYLLIVSLSWSSFMFLYKVSIPPSVIYSSVFHAGANLSLMWFVWCLFMTGFFRISLYKSNSNFVMKELSIYLGSTNHVGDCIYLLDSVYVT